jgi:DNA (cytosine-5)-methyltransferase 1
VKVLDLFAGIGGFTLGLERSGFETVAFCEIDPYAQKVLKKNWPEVPIYDDVRKITAGRLAADGIRVDVITGGFPCQDISVAGSQAGIEGDRSGLWSECARLLGELRPQYAIFENVTNLLNGERGAWFKRVLWDISALGYDAEWHCIPASAIGAHHHRDRVWIVAYPCGGEWPAGAEEQGALREMLEDGAVHDNASGRGASHASVLADTECGRQQRQRMHGRSFDTTSLEDWQASWIINRCQGDSSIWDAEPNVGRVANGIPSRSHRLKCLGNAVVPQIPELIGRAIK